MTTKRAFPLGSVLTVLHGQYLAETEDQVRELLAFLIGNDTYLAMDGIPPSAVVQEREALRRQLPELAAATSPPEHLTPTTVYVWLRQMIIQHGAVVEVEPTHPR